MVLGVAVVAAVVSYRHAFAVVSSYGGDGITAFVIPLTIDGRVYASSMVLLDAARNKVPTPVLAWLLLGWGITAALAANVAHGVQHGPICAVVAAWPAAVLVGCYEMLMWLVRADAKRPVGRSGVDLDQRAPAAHRESVEAGERLSERRLAEMSGRPRRWARSVIEESCSMKKKSGHSFLAGRRITPHAGDLIVMAMWVVPPTWQVRGKEISDLPESRV
ncbi:DUF2637 domain-containing protein [Actinorugispora endophytica]|uniref:DUF2637 domain-containing protein n=1 Tax=Actinorugispora endophytica TaxID=1605990 RepID=UPI00105ED1CE|nr:DUF2637 domain-containing protein [Actinorugispora endophytica]